MSLSETSFPLLNTSSAKEDGKLPPHYCKMVDWDIKHQTNKSYKELYDLHTSPTEDFF